MIVLDFETTGLIGADNLPEKKQPRIIEATLARLDNKSLKELERETFFINPRETINDEVLRISHIRQSDLNAAKPFEFHYATFCRMFLGEFIMVAHNCKFEHGLMAFEMARIGKALQFPWASRLVCTVEASGHLLKRRLKLDELYEMVTGKKRKGAHRTDVDVTDTITCLKWLVKKGAIVL
jgi:DNA polymerase III alpha subunit (gram-positive type)